MKPQNRFEIFMHAVFYSLLTAAAAQFQVNIFSPEFSISLGIVFFAAFTLLSDAFPVLPVSVLSGFFVMLSRTFYACLNGNTFFPSLSASAPEFGFYIFYGIFLFFCLRKKGLTVRFPSAFPALFLCDYLANFSELMLRLNINAFSRSSQSGILLAAFVRTILIFLFVTLFRRYHLILMRREQRDYYQNLTLLTSRLQEEIIWMRKNTSMVEHSMQAAYQLFERLRAGNSTKDAAKDALIIANDIHEIKKEYQLILRGLSESLSVENGKETVRFSDIFSILEAPIRSFAASLDKTLEYRVHTAVSIQTCRQYCLLSVFRNLFMNAVEAVRTKEVILSVEVEDTGNSVVCTVTDNGPGIPADILPMIFDAGFSTKINYETGEISRGLGLHIVKDIVEQRLNGSIRAESSPDGTTFYIQFDKTALEEIQ